VSDFGDTQSALTNNTMVVAELKKKRVFVFVDINSFKYHITKSAQMCHWHKYAQLVIILKYFERLCFYIHDGQSQLTSL
jgi:hypothetical protein